MRIQGTEITEAQQAAGLAAMVGDFTSGDVRAALHAAGLEDDANWVVGRTADALLQRARKAGKISPVNNKVWRATP